MGEVASLAVSGVAKTFHPGTPSERRALAGIDLTLANGDFTVVIGSNGAGKSTLLNVVAGEIMPDSGSVTIAGDDVTAMPVHRRARYVARVFQDPAIGTAAGLTVEENLAVALKRGEGRGLFYSLTGARRRQFMDALAPLGLGLEERLGTGVEMLSGGQRQALSLIMACLRRPKVLVLDEHCAALDPRTADAVMRATIQAVEGSHITTLMITHNMQHAIDCGNRLVMMHEGRIVYEAAGEEKAGLTVDALVARFHGADDKVLLV
ncbi:ABC transporter ATP-binding protein [Acuticoccus kandeliae]|uniref:ABC transporter ATP-binding protein n=1 Tax=Acuticoccus kandeliae TaxID=2073160 RepID=UPI000D3E3118|nr:ATP-binding cassette domain-containing protein [Acuticoccus kandeliae]